MSKYEPLWKYLKENNKENYKLSYEEIRKILGFDIDHSFLILIILFAILNLIGGYLVVTHKLDNAGYSVIPMLFTLIFSILYRNSKKDKE